MSSANGSDHQGLQDRQQIRELLENWVVWRDAGQWDRLVGLWHPEGRMVATWSEGTGAEFVENCKVVWSKGGNVIHRLGGISIDVAGDRAVSQAKMTITQRSSFEGVLCDIQCAGRFYDLLEKRDGRWGIIVRQAIYESDRIDPVVPGSVPVLDEALLNDFPAGYKHLAYLQTRMGFKVRKTMAGSRGPEIEALYKQGADWLSDR
jgi:hypothetical protein